MAILEVGQGKIYTTIQSAIDASSTNDIIYIMAGYYTENVVINKLVHLRGDNPNSVKDVITIFSENTYPLSIDYLPTSSGIIYVEGITLARGQTGSDSVFALVSSNTYLTINLNKCNLKVNPTGNASSIYLNSDCAAFNISYCYLSRNSFHTRMLERSTISSVTKTECDSTFTYEFGAPTVEDTVSIPATGYGPEYGNYYTTPYMYYFSGYTKELGNPVSRVVKAFTKDKYAYSYEVEDYIYTCMSDTVSASGTGYFYLQTTFSGAHQIICEDSEDGVKYNDLIFSNVYPATVSGFSGLP